MVGREEVLPDARFPSRPLVVNGALFEMLDFNDAHIPIYLHATSAVLPAVLAVAAEGACSDRELLPSWRSGSRRRARRS